jgi:predicted RNA-binding Zn ribbon-like protein
LRVPADLARWFIEAGLLDANVDVSTGQLTQARGLREAIYRAVRAGMAGEQLTDADRKLVNRFARDAPVHPQLGPNLQRHTWAGPDPVAAGLASIAVDAIALLSGPEIARVRECEASDCALLFLDTSRPGRRRWCADSACGSRARAAAYRSRRRARAR